MSHTTAHLIAFVVLGHMTFMKAQHTILFYFCKYLHRCFLVNR
uniref:Uncharacterized protein n=1 Tax=Anguilla anguilla TaxID=7936 RepID=A0A0E9Q351_ANGAN